MHVLSIIICLMLIILSLYMIISIYDILSYIVAVFCTIFSIVLFILVCIPLPINKPIDKLKSYCLDLKLVNGSTMVECFDLSAEQLKNLKIYSNNGSYWLITSVNEKSLFVKYQTELNPAVIDFHIIQ